MLASGLAGPRHLRNLFIPSPRSDFFDYAINSIFVDFLNAPTTNIENLASIKNIMSSTYDAIDSRYLRIFLKSENPVFIWLCMADLREFTLAFDRCFHDSFPGLAGQTFLKPLPDWITHYLADSALGLETLVGQISRPITGRTQKRASEVRPGEHLRDVPKILGFTKQSVNNLQKARAELLNMTIVFMAHRKGLNKTQAASLLYRFRNPDEQIEGQAYTPVSGNTHTNQDTRVVDRETELLGITWDK